MTAIAASAHVLIGRTLICIAILYHFQIALLCGRTNRRFIPVTLFLLSRPLEQLEFIRESNFQQNIFHRSSDSATTIYAPTQTPKSISTTSLSHQTSSSTPPCVRALPNFLVSYSRRKGRIRPLSLHITCSSTISRHAPPLSNASLNKRHNGKGLFFFSSAARTFWSLSCSSSVEYSEDMLRSLFLL